MKYKIYVKILSILLVCTLLLQNTPPIVISAHTSGIETIDSKEQPLEQPPEQVPLEEAYILYELEEKRTVDTKHFLMSDRSVLAAVYEKPVHYYEDEKWKEIDASPKESGDELEITKNAFETKFSKKSNGKKLVTLKKSDFTVSFYLEDAKKVDAVTSSHDSSETSSEKENLSA